MALNYSYRPIFPAHLAEDNLVSPMSITNGYLVEGIPERNSIRQWPSNREVQDMDNNKNMDWDHVLPADPFGMDISSTFEAITEFLYLEAVGVINQAAINFHHSIPGNAKVDYNMWTGSVMFDNCNGGVGSKSTTENVEVGGSTGGVEILSTSERVGFDEGIGAVGIPTTRTKRVESNDGGNGGVGVLSTTKSVEFDDGNCGIDRLVDADLDDGSPHPALSFALGYLGVRDLLSVEMVCKSLCSTVQNDPLLWRSIYIVPPLSERITDDILLNLTSRAQGNLQCLRLVSCQRITDSGLRRVLESNKRLTKLSVPECNRLSIDGIVSSLRAFQRVAVTGIKHLGIAGLHGVSQERYEDIVSLLGVHNYLQASYHKSRIYYSKNGDVTCEDDRPIDIEMCPRCQKFRRVFDCPAESCQGQDRNAQSCRACLFCIPRCSDCKKCMHDSYEETFTLDLVCTRCFLEAKQDVKHSFSNHAVCQEQGSSFNG